jgi:hypothetical protein
MASPNKNQPTTEITKPAETAPAASSAQAVDSKLLSENEALKAEVARLREQNDAVKADLDITKTELKAANNKFQVIQDKVEEAALAAAKKELGPEGSAKPAVPEKWRGVKYYRIGSSGGFHNNQVYRQGDVIRLENEGPSRTWTEITAAQFAAARANPGETKPTVAGPDAAETRASDVEI